MSNNYIKRGDDETCEEYLRRIKAPGLRDIRQRLLRLAPSRPTQGHLVQVAGATRSNEEVLRAIGRDVIRICEALGIEPECRWKYTARSDGVPSENAQGAQ